MEMETLEIRGKHSPSRPKRRQSAGGWQGKRPWGVLLWACVHPNQIANEKKGATGREGAKM